VFWLKCSKNSDEFQGWQIGRFLEAQLYCVLCMTAGYTERVGIVWIDSFEGRMDVVLCGVLITLAGSSP